MEKRGNITLYNADCLDIMREMPDKAFDLAIIDPPYRDISENQPIKHMRNSGNISLFGNKPTKEYFDELYRISKEQIIFGANNFQLKPYKGFIVWRKTNIPSDKFTLSAVELASVSEGLSTTSKYFEYSSLDLDKVHPTQKPVALYKWLLANYAKEGDKILDTHFGSLSIGIACHDAGFELTAIELDKDYYEDGKKILENHMLQQRLF